MSACLSVCLSARLPSVSCWGKQRRFIWSRSCCSPSTRSPTSTQSPNSSRPVTDPQTFSRLPDLFWTPYRPSSLTGRWTWLSWKQQQTNCEIRRSQSVDHFSSQVFYFESVDMTSQQLEVFWLLIGRFVGRHQRDRLIDEFLTDLSLVYLQCSVQCSLLSF